MGLFNNFSNLTNKTKGFLADIIWGDVATQEKPLDLIEEIDTDSESLRKLSRFLSTPSNRAQLYEDLELMEQASIPKSVLEIYADDIFSTRGGQDILWVTAEKQSIADEANQKLVDWGIMDRLHELGYFLAFFGDFFIKLNGEDKKGVQSLEFDKHPVIFRRWKKVSELIGFTIDSDVDDGTGFRQRLRKDEINLLPPWDVVHLRNGISSMQLKKKSTTGITEGVYGSSIFHANMHDWKKLNLMENSMVISRYSKSRRPAFLYIDLTNIEGSEKKKQWFNSVKNKVLNKTSLNVQEGRFDVLKDLMGSSQIIPIPVEDGKGKIDFQDLSETPNIKSIIDVEHIRDKFFGSIRVPSAFLGLEGKIPSNVGGTSALKPISIRYARTVRKIQRTILNGIRRILRIHFSYKRNFLKPTEITVNTPSVTTAEDLERAETTNKLISTFSSLGQLFSRTIDVDINQEKLAEFIINSLNIPGLSAEDILDLEKAEEVKKPQLEKIYNYLTPSSNPRYSDNGAMVPYVDDSSKQFDEWRKKVNESID